MSQDSECSDLMPPLHNAGLVLILSQLTESENVNKTNTNITTEGGLRHA